MQSIKNLLAVLSLAAVSLVGVSEIDGQVGLDPAPALPEIPVEHDTDDVEPLVRGPVHEAYAQPVDLLPEPGDVIPKGPPDPIPEIPPDMRPEGDGVIWIPGYWSWDPESAQFVWVSGVYRNAPEGRQWVPGHWVHTEEGWRWVPGFWAGAGAEELPYTPEPPESLERGPTLPPPDAESVYVPGIWVYRETRFAWRPGYYAPFRPGRIWIHARYVWTPQGCIFVDGYHDYPWEERGVLFSPVVFYRPLWRDPLWRYCPSFVVRHNHFHDSLFFNRGFRHYYYGNYFASAGTGFQPWFRGANRFDPHFQYYRATNRHDPRWAANLTAVYADRTAGRAVAPPTTFRQQQKLFARADGGPVNRNLQVVAPLRSSAGELRLTKLGPAQLEAQRSFGDQARDLARNRAKFENTGAKLPKFHKGERRTLKLPAAEARITPPALDRFSPGKLPRDDRGGLILPGGGGAGIPKGTGTPKIDIPKKFDVPKIVTGPPKGIDTPKGTGTKGPGAKIETPRVIDTPRLPGGLPKVDGPKGGTPRIIGEPGKTPGPRIDLPKSPPVVPKVGFPKTPRIINELPKAALPKIEAPKGPPLTPKVEIPKTPRVITPKIEAPRVTTPSPRIETPKVTTPAPRITAPAPKTEMPKVIRSTPAPRIEAPKATTPAPRITAPAPKIEMPKVIRSTPAPRISTPPPAPKVGTAAPRIAAPAPRITTPTPRISTPAPTPRISAPVLRSPGPGSGKIGGGGGGGGRVGGGGGKGKGR